MTEKKKKTPPQIKVLEELPDGKGGTRLKNVGIGWFHKDNLGGSIYVDEIDGSRRKLVLRMEGGQAEPPAPSSAPVKQEDAAAYDVAGAGDIEEPKAPDAFNAAATAKRAPASAAAALGMVPTCPRCQGRGVIEHHTYGPRPCPECRDVSKG